MPLGGKSQGKPSLEEEYFALQKQFEDANARLSGMPPGSTADKTGILTKLSGLAKEAGAGVVGNAMWPFEAAGAGADTAAKLLGPTAGRLAAPVVAPLGSLAQVYNAASGTPPGPSESMFRKVGETYRQKLGLNPAGPQSLSDWAANLAGMAGPSLGVGLARRLLRSPATAAKTAEEINTVANPVLQRALALAEQKALPPGRFTRGTFAPEFTTKSGLEGPVKYRAPVPGGIPTATPTISPKPSGLKRPRRVLTVPTAPSTSVSVAPPVLEPINEFKSYLGTVENVSSETQALLSRAHAARGMEGVYDVASELAKQGKLFVK